MSFRALLSSRSLINVTRSAHIVRTLTTRARVSPSIVARSGFRGVQVRGFQSSAIRAFPAPAEDSIDAELSKKLGEELKLEGSVEDGMEIPPSIQEYLEKGPFKVIDVPGSDEVTLSRQYGSETIKVQFSISAANFDNDVDDDYNWDEEDDNSGDDGGMVNEEPDLPTIDSKSGRVMSKPRKSGSPLEWLLGVKQSGFSPAVAKKKEKGKGNKRFEEPEAEEEEFPESEEYDEELTGEEDWDEDQPESRYAPISTRITITKGADAGTLTVHATATESIFVIENVAFDAEKAPAAPTAEGEFQSRNRYDGPPWQQLDEDLQLLMERYLEERGINTALAVFIPDYAELKEQKEYISWLKNLKSFVDK